ncbi:MAG TPA: FmdB family zinc ribbon protein, partial [Kineosporiaceae bacterium]|nr:FmdB family zinc ribbon protein [Kineosporiaceae bacterium]
MPTYAYACTACDHRFEAQQAFTDDALTQCPECAGRLRKLFNSVGIVFKGSGFYRNDSREKAGAKKGSNGSASSSGSADSGSSTGGSSDSGSSSDSSGSSAAASNGSSGGSSQGGSSSGGSQGGSSSGGSQG